MRMEQEESFTASIKIAGINPYVDVPQRVVEDFDGGTKAAVLVKVARAGLVNTKESAYQANERLIMDAEQLKAMCRLAPGD